MKSDRELKIGLKASKFELLVPANNLDIAIKAIKAGADAVYIGYSKYGARVQAGNSLEDLIELVEFAHQYRVKIYVTLNTILKDEEIDKIEKLIWKLYRIKVDGIIIQDMGILKCKLPPIPLIASTQCHNNSIEKIKFLEKTGFKRVILPRETSLEQMHEIKENTKIEVESFVHGALCVCYSGQCYLSYAIGKRSANRGECAQPCRKKYSLKDADGKSILKDKYILSLKDLNLSDRLLDLIMAGVSSFKIEGRLKNEAYVINTTSYYRNVLDSALNTLGIKKASEGICNIDFEPDLDKTFNRGYTNFYLDSEKNNLATVNYNSSIGEFIGVVQNVKKNYFSMNTSILNNGDGICFFDENKEMHGTNINRTEGDTVFPADIKGIKQGVKIYRNYNKEFDDKLKSSKLSRKIPVSIRVRELCDSYIFFMSDSERNCSTFMLNKNFEAAINKDKSLAAMQVQLSKAGDSEFFVDDINIKLKNVPFIKVSQLNDIRRNLIASLRKIRRKNYKYEYRFDKINIVDYPQRYLDYRANISNKKAYEFYSERGCIINEMALETQSCVKDKTVMTSKYCIKNQLGLCPKKTHIKKYVEPYVLTDEFNKEYFVEFDCKKCVMSIRV